MPEKIKVNNCKWIKIPSIIDGYDGILSILENGSSVLFDIKRVYYIYNLINHKNVIRGKHAHKKLEQVLFCINGSCNIALDDGKNKQTVLLNRPNIGIHISAELWHIMKNFNNNCIILVLASELYDESDYIRDHKQFLKYVNKDNDTI